MNTSLENFIRRIETFRDRIPVENSEIRQEIELLATFLNEILVKGIDGERELWQERMKLKDERNSMLFEELHQKKKELEVIEERKDKKVRELEWEIEKLKNELDEKSKNYRERLNIRDEENRLARETLIERDKEGEELNVGRDRELKELKEELRSLEEELNKVMEESKKNKELKEKYEKEIVRLKRINEEMKIEQLITGKKAEEVVEEDIPETIEEVKEEKTEEVKEEKKPDEPVTTKIGSGIKVTDIAKIKKEIEGIWQDKIRRKEVEYTDITEMLSRGFAHRLRNYVGIISGTVQLCISQLDDTSNGNKKGIKDKIKAIKEILSDSPQSQKENETMKDDLETVMQQVEEMTRAIKSFVDLARSPEILIQEISLLSEIKAAVGFYDTKIKDQKIEVKYKNEKLMDKCFADKKTVQEIFTDIIQNAVEAMQKGGVLTIDAAKAEDGNEKYVEVKVSDTGSGIPEHIQTKVYQPFFTTKQGRDGLGMPRTRRDVLLNSGSILVESKKGVGTTIKIQFLKKNQ